MGIGLPYPDVGLDIGDALNACDMGESDDVSWFPVDSVALECAERELDEGDVSDLGVE